jgi:predicted CxxxxCH...CXXCH cytochrome family protein
VEPDYSAPPSRVCSVCHGYPPPSPHPQSATSCSGCHSATVRPDGSVDVAGGRHIDGQIDFAVDAGSGCAGCHDFPPAAGAHAAHFGLAGAEASGVYGDTWTLQDRYPGTPAPLAPPGYAFGCGNCHPLDLSKHMDGALQVELHDDAAPSDSLKARAQPTAGYDPSTGTCSGTYCHSTGEEMPISVTSPDWFGATQLACDGCHGNPPRYESGAAGMANSHLAMGSNGREWGHFLGEAGPRHGSYHGGAVAGRAAAPITCQTCHFDTTDPANTGPSGFYYLDTTGAYQLPGGDPARLTTAKYLQLQCTLCHADGGPAAPRTGKVLPLRHVNGSPDVVFDPRTTLPDISWLPAAPNRPTLPYWESGANAGVWRGVTWSGTTVSFALAGASYDPLTKTCSNVACHLFRPPVWGAPYTCTQCHAIH